MLVSPQRESGWEDVGGYAGGGSRQANFLQKLYEFLSLDPHPCPEVIYWASDSRQLVIAQPDRVSHGIKVNINHHHCVPGSIVMGNDADETDQLVKEVLPRLFKHDKLSSFGRQLNIYGFSRLFPGRQFKDASGKISDASVWAHPSLHRLSSPAEISSIKRRAAPKLFRTRRLANGQVVRTRAGPGVEAKFREVRENIAETRRARGSLTTPAHPQTTSAQEYDYPFSGGSGGGGGESLGRIDEGVVANDVSGHPFTPFQSSFDAFDQHRRGSTMSIDDFPRNQDHGGLATPAPMFTAPHGLLPMPMHPHEHLPLTPIEMRPFQSCPASVHSSPVPARLAIEGWGNLFNPTITQPGSDQQPYESPFIRSAKPQLRIAAPAAPDPFYPSHQQDSKDYNPPFDTYQVSPTDGSWSSIQSPHPDLFSPTFNWEQGQSTIDPRWISPSSTTAWSTPNATRPPSPASPPFQAQSDPNHKPHIEDGEENAPQSQSAYFTNSHIAFLGTQSYPPRGIERRAIEVPNTSPTFPPVAHIGDLGPSFSLDNQNQNHTHNTIAVDGEESGGGGGGGSRWWR
ncbi:hypothetical protein BCR39DRAFT_599265 [Naematelia encephala]|uniref:HSF-type DNA-binding domain-containing protein n=1 Tax=Naematelia encephala TaxID=71784 RepID=A0A1Y2AYS7_9TREE|nr:hypothetical protein BCR39DRAFT_599265 [Naematelia encephala]